MTVAPELRAAGPGLEVLVFEVGGKRCAIPTRSVVEVLHAVAITPVPGAPPLVEGVVNVRGLVVPVVDARSWFQRPPRAVEPGDHFIVATAGARRLVLRVDRATDLACVDAAQLDGPPAGAPGAYLSGVVEIEDGLVVIRDVTAFLGEAETRALDDALAAGTAP